MKNLRALFALLLVQFILLPLVGHGQAITETGQIPKTRFHFADYADLQETMKESFDSMNVWLESPRSPTTFKEAYAHSLSFKLALNAQAAKETNTDFRTQMKELVPKVTSIIGHLEQFAGNDLASRKLASVSLEVAADTAKRDELVQSAVSAAIYSLSGVTTNAEVTATSDAFSAICQQWEQYGGPLDAASRRGRNASESTSRAIDDYNRTHPIKPVSPSKR